MRCRRDARTGAACRDARSESSVRPVGELILVIPPYAKREQRFSAEGGRKPKGERGERSQGRSVRRGTRSAQARFWERGRSGRGRTERRRESLTLRGMRPRTDSPEVPSIASVDDLGLPGNAELGAVRLG